jgi:hypothetical protein
MSGKVVAAMFEVEAVDGIKTFAAVLLKQGEQKQQQWRTKLQN